MTALRTPSSSNRVRKAVKAGVMHWWVRNGTLPEKPHTPVVHPAAKDILKPIGRRTSYETGEVPDIDVIPTFKAIEFSGSKLYSLVRLFTWITVILRIVFGNGFDWLLRRSSVERKAVRLRKNLEWAGGTFVKLGQQAAMRIDLLPWAYCVELSRMHDRMIPFAAEHALNAIERTTGKSWQDIFSVFDPEPVGSASIACVYQAVLKNGKKVAVKVRRPNIIKIFLADLQVLDWLSNSAEFLTILRKDFTTNLRAELRETLLDELDFRTEARFQDTFRRNAKKSGEKYFNAPEVLFEYSGEEVLVQEFVQGLWLSEVIHAVETSDPKGRELLRKMNIDPKVVAHRILWASFWSMDEHIFFHADPHPANILVRPNCELTFIDFGSCGSFNNHQRVSLEQLVISMNNQDAEGMTLATLSLMEPLPRIDIPKFVQDSQSEYMRLLNTYNTPAKYTKYWERTTARQWFVLFRTAQQYNIPLNLHMLRMIRATLLYDSIVLRLDNKLDRYGEYTNFMRDRADLIRKRWRKNAKNFAGDNLLLRVEELSDSIGDLVIRTQAILGKPIVKYGSTIDKVIFSASVATRLIARIIFITFFLLLGISTKNLITGEIVGFYNSLIGLVTNPYYLGFMIALVLLNLRLIILRLADRDSIS